MNDFAADTSRLLAAARERGQKILAGAPPLTGLDQVAVYVGLIGSALELAKLVQTEERDLKVIEAHYSIEISRINAAFKETEMAMQLAFDRDHSLRAKTFKVIELLISANQHEIALKFYERMLDGFSNITLDSLLARHSAATEGTGMSVKRL